MYVENICVVPPNLNKRATGRAATAQILCFMPLDNESMLK